MALHVMVGARPEPAVDNSPIGTYRFSYNSGGHYKDPQPEGATLPRSGSHAVLEVRTPSD